MFEKRVSRRDFHCNFKNSTSHFREENSYFGETTFPPCFPLRPCVFHQTLCFPPDPVFSTPRVFHTPGPRTPYHGTPAPRFPPSRLTRDLDTCTLVANFFFFVVLFCFFLRLILFTANDYNFLHFTPNGLIGLTVSPIESLLRLVKPPIDIIFSINCCCYLLA